MTRAASTSFCLQEQKLFSLPVKKMALNPPSKEDGISDQDGGIDPDLLDDMYFEDK